MFRKVLKLSEDDIYRFELKKKYQRENDIKNDNPMHDLTRYFFEFDLSYNAFGKIYIERMKELGMCWDYSDVDPSWIYKRLPDNFYPFKFEEIITPYVHLYFVRITLMSASELNGEHERTISGDCLMDNKRFCK